MSDLPLYEQPEVHERRWFLLGVLCLSLIMVVMAVSSLNVAMPTLQTELDTSATMLQWIVDRMPWCSPACSSPQVPSVTASVAKVRCSSVSPCSPPAR